MLPKRLIRWAGVAAVATGLLLAVADALYIAALHDPPLSVAADSATWVPWAVLSLAAGYLGLIAAAGLYLRQVTETGAWGLLGFLIAALGTSMFIGWAWAGAFVLPSLVQVAPDFLDSLRTSPSGLMAAGFLGTFLLFGLGWLLLGLATARANVLPRLPSWLLVLGAIVNLVDVFARVPFGTLILDVALVWLGWWLWSERDTAAA